MVSCSNCDTVSYAAPGSIACTVCPTPLVVDPRLGPARDESYCVCEADFFLYPSVVVTIVLKDTTTKKVRFDSPNRKLQIRGYIGNKVGEAGRSTGLKSGLPLREGFEKVELLSYGSYLTDQFRAIFQVLPATANMSSVNQLLEFSPQLKKSKMHLQIVIILKKITGQKI